MDIRHLYVRGNYREDIFFDKVDFINAWNRIWLSADSTDVEILAVELLSNHLHICARSNENTEDNGQWVSNFMHHYRQSLTQGFNRRYNLRGSLGCRRYGKGNVTDPKDDKGEDLRDVIRYIIRNVTHHGVMGDYRKWPYSTYGYVYHIDKQKDIMKWNEIPDMLLDKFIPHYRDFPKGWSMTKDGMIVPPDTLFPRIEIESLFYDEVFYAESTNTPTRREQQGNDNEESLCTNHVLTKKITDQAIINLVKEVSAVPIVEMSRIDRENAIKIIWGACPGATSRQLERIFAIPNRTICNIVKK